MEEGLVYFISVATPGYPHERWVTPRWMFAEFQEAMECSRDLYRIYTMESGFEIYIRPTLFAAAFDDIAGYTTALRRLLMPWSSSRLFVRTSKLYATRPAEWMLSREQLPFDYVETAVQVPGTQLYYCTRFNVFTRTPPPSFGYVPDFGVVVGYGAMRTVVSVVSQNVGASRTSLHAGLSTAMQNLVVVAESDIGTWCGILHLAGIKVSTSLDTSACVVLLSHAAVIADMNTRRSSPLSPSVRDFLWTRVFFQGMTHRHVVANMTWLLLDSVSMSNLLQVMSLWLPNPTLENCVWVESNTQGTIRIELRPNVMEQRVASLTNNLGAVLAAVLQGYSGGMFRIQGWEDVEAESVFMGSTLERLRGGRLECEVCMHGDCDTLLGCGHTLCFSCAWGVRFSGNNNCPWCRSPVQYPVLWNALDFEFTTTRWLIERLRAGRVTMVVCVAPMAMLHLRATLVHAGCYSAAEAERLVVTVQWLFGYADVVEIVLLGVDARNAMWSLAYCHPDARMVELHLCWGT